jgi:hypothetical protein
LWEGGCRRVGLGVLLIACACRRNKCGAVARNELSRVGQYLWLEGNTMISIWRMN